MVAWWSQVFHCDPSCSGDRRGEGCGMACRPRSPVRLECLQPIPELRVSQCTPRRVLKKSASRVPAWQVIASLRLEGSLRSPRPFVERRGHTKCGLDTKPTVDFSSAVNTEGLRPMSRWFTRSAVGTSSGLRSLRPQTRRGVSRRAGVGRVRRTAVLNILRGLSSCL